MDEPKKSIEPIEYSESEKAEFGRIIRCLNHAWDQRQQSYPEFDDMTYDQWYLANKRAASAYIPPKQNKDDPRTVSGTTREKTNTFLSAILKYTFAQNVEAFDEEDMMDVDVGMALTDLINKSRQVEVPRHDDKLTLWLQELIAQGNVFIEESFAEFRRTGKPIQNESDDVFGINWKEVDSLERYCTTEMIPGRRVLLGNIREYFMEKQPFVATFKNYDKAEAEARYGKWRRWKNVPEICTRSIGAIDSIESAPYDGFILDSIGNKKYQEIKFYDPWNNVYMILLNGVMMMPVGFPLEYLYGKIDIPIVKGNLEPISANFAYCRGIPAKTKFNQAFFDEMVRLLILKNRLIATPPMANNTGRTLSKRIFTPATIHDNIDPQKILPILTPQGYTAPEFNALYFVKGLIDESSFSPTFSGQETKGDATAQEVMQMQRQNFMRMGLAIYGVISLHTELVWKRLYNVLEHWTDPTDVAVEDIKGQIKSKKTYRIETVDTEIEDGRKGKRIIEMTTDEFPAPSQIMAEEDLLTAKTGVPIRKIYLSPEKLKTVKYRYFVKITPSEKDASELKAAMFEESVTKAKTMWPTSVNDAYVQEQWAVNQKLNPDKFFLKQPQGMPQIPQQPGNPLGAQMMPQINQQKPNLTKLLATQ